MADPPKKLTFGFSKVVKKSNLVAPPVNVKQEPSNVQLIECLEANTIKLKSGEETKTEALLVIPIIGPRKSSTIPNGKSIAEIAEDFSDTGADNTKEPENVQNENGAPSTLEEMAAREILQEGKNVGNEEVTSTLESLPTADGNEEFQKESTLEDYESIPVKQFGLAMLRGMGWKPDEGIGKNKKLVPVTAPVVRPKGMGLGADKMLAAAAKKAASTSSKDEEELKMVKGAYVKVAAGMQKDHYAQVEGFSEDSGRVLLKMAIGGHVVSVNEATVLLVSKTEYSKNSKVLNAVKYEEFKKKEETGNNTPRNRKSPSPREKTRHQSPSPPRISKKSSSNTNASRHYSPERDRSPSPNLKQRKEKNRCRSNSESPERVDRKKLNSRGQNYKYESPDRSHGRKASPADRSKASSRRRSKSISPGRNRKNQQRRSRSRSLSRSRDKYSHRRKENDSDSDSKSYSKKKKKHKEKRRAHYSSSSDESSRSRSKSPKNKKKSKRSKRSRSRSPSKKRR